MEMSPKLSPITISPKVLFNSVAVGTVTLGKNEAEIPYIRKVPPPSRQQHTPHISSHPVGVSTPILDPIALATRRTIGKGLPYFDGNPGDWYFFL